LPNAGKSTLLRAVSAATPKVADYPFTTLHPCLGVVSVSSDAQFVMADIPGLIEGAASGVGLGLRFLKHLARCKVLLHIIDLSASIDEMVAAYRVISAELKAYDQALSEKPTLLVFNKIDAMLADEAEEKIKAVIEKLDVHQKYYSISAISGKNCDTLCKAVLHYLTEEVSA
jgi:GTPase